MTVLASQPAVLVSNVQPETAGSCCFHNAVTPAERPWSEQHLSLADFEGAAVQPASLKSGLKAHVLIAGTGRLRRTNRHEDVAFYGDAEDAAIQELRLVGSIRETYVHSAGRCVTILFELANVEVAGLVVAELPLVLSDLMTFKFDGLKTVKDWSAGPSCGHEASTRMSSGHIRPVEG